METLNVKSTPLQVCIGDFVDHPVSHPDWGRGLHQFLRQSGPLYCSIRDPLSFNTDGPTTDEYISVMTRSGRRKLTADAFVEIQRALNVDLLSIICDEPAQNAGMKRAQKAVHSSLAFIDATLAALAPGSAAAGPPAAGADEASAPPAAAAAAGSSLPALILGCVQGGAFPALRAASAKATASRGVGGFVIGGFGLGESPDARRPLINAVLPHLPEEKLRLISGLGRPLEVLEGVEYGIDIFDTAYPYTCTQLGYALTFKFDACETDDPATQSCAPLALRDTLHKVDARPLVAGCRCFACTRHTRAYVHHLLNTHEMLGEVLLMLHNTHHYLLFFERVRASIADGSFARLRDAFVARYRGGDGSAAEARAAA